MQLSIIEGDLLDQDVDVIVNAWNRNIIPWWLLLPQGVSGAIKKRGGYAPFRELGKKGSYSAGRCPSKQVQEFAIQGDHPRRRHQHAVAIVAAVDPRFGSQCHAYCCRAGIPSQSHSL